MNIWNLLKFYVIKYNYYVDNIVIHANQKGAKHYLLITFRVEILTNSCGILQVLLFVKGFNKKHNTIIRVQ